MKSTAILVSLNGWADTLLESPYLVIAIVGGVVVIVFGYALWRWLRKPKTASHPAAPQESQPNEIAAPLPENQPAEISAENYAHCVAEKILAINGKTKSVLLAGAGLESLPVTISVKASIQLAQAGKKCILIDLDTRRNAAAKVFDVHFNNARHPYPKPVPTIIDNLSLWPAEFFVRFARMNLQHVVQYSHKEYEVVLINAPYLDGHPDRKLIASCAEYGLIFCRKPQQLERLTKLLSNGECKLLDPIPANQ